MSLPDSFKLISVNIFWFWQVLDWALGKEHSVLLNRSKLKTFMDLHADEVFLCNILLAMN